MVFGFGGGGGAQAEKPQGKGVVHLDLDPLTQADIPDPSTPAFAQFLDDHFAAGQQLAESIGDWKKHSIKCDGTVQIVNINNHPVKKELGISEVWCGRYSTHTTESVREHTRRMSRRMSSSHGKATQATGESEADRQAVFMSTAPNGLYERFRRGLLEYHSEHEREYIESMRETECLQVFQPHVAEVWRLTFKTPPPTNPRTFVILLLSREIRSGPDGERCFMNSSSSQCCLNGLGADGMTVSLPFDHPDCQPKQGKEAERVRGKYVSVEQVTERAGGQEVDWRMATSSDAGGASSPFIQPWPALTDSGNIPRFVTNSSLPSSIAEDVPSFLSWLEKKFPGPDGGAIASQPAAGA